MLTQEKVRRLLEHKEGKLFWRKRASSRVDAGAEAGVVNTRGYRHLCISGKFYLSHRIIWLYEYGYFPENGIDHINRNKLDNCLKNLREVSQSCNLKNSKLSKSNKSGVKGVCWNKRDKGWRASIYDNGKGIYFMVVADLLEAACYRLAAEQCLGWEGCDSSSPAFQYVQKHINKGVK